MDEEEQEDTLDPFPGYLERIRANSVEGVDLDYRYLDHEEAIRLAEALQGNRSVVRLFLKETVFDDDDLAKLEALVPALQTSRVTHLDLSSNKINEDGMVVLLASLRGSQVQSLWLNGNLLEDQGAVALADILQDLSLTDLSVRGNKIADAGAKGIAAALATSALTVLDLAENFIGLAGAQALAKALPASPLRDLSLGNNKLGHAGVKVLADALKSSKLKQLSLRGSDIHGEVLMALVAGIRGSALVELDLSHNPLGDEGAKAFAGLLKESDIEALCVHTCGIGDEGFAAFLEAAPDSAVASLRFSMFGVTEGNALLEQIKAILEANKARTFVLQMHVEGDEAEWTFTFRTMAGAVAAVLNWSSNRPAKDLPEAVFSAMRASEFQLPCRHLRTRHLRILRPDGQLLEVGDTAAPLAQQVETQVKRNRLC